MTVRWIIGATLLLVFAYCTILQLAYVIAFLLKKTTKHSSLAPVFPVGLIGLLALPDPTLIRKWFWVPLVVDPGFYMPIVGLPIAIIKNL